MPAVSEQPYEILGNRTAIMRGRKKQVEGLLQHLTKATPDHVSVIGPKYIGKTVLLKHMADRLARTPDHYLTAVYWDLRHGAPTTDDEFRNQLAREVARVLDPLREDLADENPDYDWLTVVFGILETEKKCVLVVLDGLDGILGATGITRNLWDNLRALAQKRSLRLLTGSRRRLRDICASEESRTSDFWEIFYDTPFTVGPFDAGDWDDLLAPITAKRPIDASARKEVANWTGGIPLLVAALATRLLDRPGSEPLTKADVDSCAEQLLAETPHLDALWDDCDEELKGDLVALSRAPLPVSKVPQARKLSLLGRGYAAESGGQLKSASRFMEAFAKAKGPKVSDLRRLFADSGEYTQNIRSFLELRLGQVGSKHADLRMAVEKAIREIDPKDPAACFVWLRRIGAAAFNAIWKVEAPHNTLPPAWMSALASEGSSSWAPGGRVPSSLGVQCRLLDFITDTQAPLARYVTKPSYLLLNTLKGAGDLGQHMGKAKVTVPMAAALCLCAVELLEALDRELP
jgi:hypothetical protein